MKYSISTNRFFLLLIPLLFTGCYTQLQTFDKFPVEEDRYAGYYAWDGFEEARTSSEAGQEENSAFNHEGEYSSDEELALEENNIYYIDLETARWYEEHYANKMFWEGYSIGYEDGFHDGSEAYYPYSARFSLNRHRYAYGYTGAFEYYDFYGFPYPYYPRLFYNRYHFYPGFVGNYADYDFYRYSWRAALGGCANITFAVSPFYDQYYGCYSYSYYLRYGYGHAYNYYHKVKKYRRDADIYRDGPRNRGLVNSSDIRSRSGDGLTRTQNSGLSRTRGTNSSVRVRGTGSSTNRGSSVGRSSGSRTRGSSVGNKRSGTKTGKSRGTGSSVKRDRGTKKGGAKSSGTRSRSRDNKSSSFSGTSVRTINISDFNNRTYTIPSRRVKTQSINRSSNRSKFGSFLKRTILSPGLNSFEYENNPRAIHRVGSVGNSRVKTSKPSTGTTINRSSTSKRSSGTRVRSSSSGSSNKGSRGDN